MTLPLTVGMSFPAVKFMEARALAALRPHSRSASGRAAPWTARLARAILSRWELCERAKDRYGGGQPKQLAHFERDRPCPDRIENLAWLCKAEPLTKFWVRLRCTKAIEQNVSERPSKTIVIGISLGYVAKLINACQKSLGAISPLTTPSRPHLSTRSIRIILHMRNVHLMWRGE